MAVGEETLGSEARIWRAASRWAAHWVRLLERSAIF